MGEEADFRFKIILLGNIDVGKTSLIIRFSDRTFHEEILGEIDQKTRDLKIDDKNVKLIITDTAGQERFRTLTSSYYRNADAIVVVYDITDRESFGDVEGHLTEGTRYSQRSEKFIVGNKIDLEANRKVSTEEAKSLADKQGIFFTETSAKEGTGVDALFEIIAKKLMKANAGNDTTTTRLSTSSAKVDLTAPAPAKKTPEKKGGGFCSLL